MLHTRCAFPSTGYWIQPRPPRLLPPPPHPLGVVVPVSQRLAFLVELVLFRAPRMLCSTALRADGSNTPAVSIVKGIHRVWQVLAMCTRFARILLCLVAHHGCWGSLAPDSQL